MLTVSAPRQRQASPAIYFRNAESRQSRSMIFGRVDQAMPGDQHAVGGCIREISASSAAQALIMRKGMTW